MINTLVLDRSSLGFTEFNDPDRISDFCQQPLSVIWADVTDPQDQDFDDLAREFGFHPLAIEDCRHPHQRPKIDEYSGYYFIVLYEASLNEDHQLELRELNIFLGPNYIVTVHSQTIRAIEAARKHWQSRTDLAERRTGIVTYLMIDTIVDEYLSLLDRLSDRLEDLEEHIFDDFHPEALEEIFRVKKQLLFMRRAVSPVREIFNMLLKRDQPIFSRETLMYFQDVYDHLIRVVEAIDTLREIVGSTMDAYLSVSGNRLNKVMKQLTSISAILMSITLISSIYGMNFQFMPELGTRYGYVGALSFMLVIGIALYFYFRRINWL